MKKAIRVFAVLLVLGLSTATTFQSSVTGGEPIPTCNPLDPSCVPQVPSAR